VIRYRGQTLPEPHSLADLKRDFAEILAPYEKELRAEERARLWRERAAEDKRLHDWFCDVGRA